MAQIVDDDQLEALLEAGRELYALANNQTSGHNCEVVAKREHRPLESWCSLCAAVVAWERAVAHSDGGECG